MTEYDIRWVAGFLEGEGTFGLRSKVTIYVSATSTDLDVLEHLKRIVDSGSIYAITKRKAHWKDAWIWSVTCKKARELMAAILPFMGKRRSIKIQTLLNNHAAAAAKSDLVKSEIIAKRNRIRDLHRSGLTHAAIAREIGHERSYVTHILNGRYD